MRKSLPESYKKFKFQFPNLIVFTQVVVVLFDESDFEIEQTNCAISHQFEFTNHKKFNPDKHLFIGRGKLNEPWYIDAKDPNPKIYSTLLSRKDDISKESCIANSFDELTIILRNLMELEKEMQHNPTQEILDLYFDQIKKAVGDANMEYWDLFYGEGEWWIEHGHPDK